ncbi:MAG: hypothetical protein KGI66_02145, partial [Patescibacteria group bacterium]|nr:hypothetical protein [Patescibacteria group bacterium]
SSTPVGGYGASTTGSTTIVRWIDRGRGNVIEAREDSLGLTTISNTVLPRIYESAWNKNLTSFVGGMLETDTGIPTFVYANIVKRPGGSSAASSTSTGVESTPFELKGGSLPADVIAFAPSPDGSKIFFMTKESGYGVGYIANYDGSGMKRIFSTPLTQVNVEWPVADTLAIATKGSATEAGFLYFFDIKTGAWKKIAGPLLGLSARVSHDGKYVLLSSTGTAKDVLTAIYNVSKGTYTDAVIRTLADKCAWGNFYQDIVYCAVPSQPVPGTYPDDWYTGTLSTVDKIWQENAQTGEIHLISSIVDQSDRVIDAFNLGLDRKDQYLFFMNKNDLTLWSLDLVASQ